MRALKLFFRTVLCAMLPVCLLCGGLSVSAYNGKSNQNRAEGSNLRVMTYNVWADPGEGGFPKWNTPAIGTRPNGAIACIKHYAPDVVGLQECSLNWYKALRPGLPDYAFVNTEDGGRADYMCTGLMYNKKTVELLSSEIIGYNEAYWGRQRMRYINTGYFKIKATGETFVFISTHFDAGKVEEEGTYRPAQAIQLGEQIKHFKAKYGCPIISVGDYNSQLNDTPLNSVMSRGGMSAATTGGIDHILFSAGITRKYVTIVTDDAIQGSSDHKPVFADLAVTKHTFPTTKATTTTTTTTAPTAAHNVVGNNATQADDGDAQEDDADGTVDADVGTDAQDGSSDGDSTIVIQGEDEKGGGFATDLTPLLNVAKWIGIGLAGAVVLGVGITATVLMIKNRKKK